MAITIAIPCQPNFWQYRTSVYRKFGMVMVIDFTKLKVWYGNWYKNFGMVTVLNPPQGGQRTRTTEGCRTDYRHISQPNRLIWYFGSFNQVTKTNDSPMSGPHLPSLKYSQSSREYVYFLPHIHLELMFVCLFYFLLSFLGILLRRNVR